MGPFTKKRNRRRNEKRRRRTHRLGAGMEALQQRILLAADTGAGFPDGDNFAAAGIYSDFQDGSVRIVGSPLDDRVCVRTVDAPGLGSSLMEVVVTWGAGEEDTQLFDRSAVSRIEFYGYDGADRFENATDVDSYVEGGRGRDSLIGGGGNDVLHGNQGADRLYGEENDDSLYGEENDDSLFGGTGNDVLHGNQGADRLYGEENDDSLYGEENDDSLFGGAGADRFFEAVHTYVTPAV